MSAYIVWIPILEEDTLEAAIPSVRSLDDSRIHHFYDPTRSVGKAIAESVKWSDNTAWDIYLFYSPADRWIEKAPGPKRWMHQLKDAWATKETYRTGKDLSAELKATMRELFY